MPHQSKEPTAAVHQREEAEDEAAHPPMRGQFAFYDKLENR